MKYSDRKMLLALFAALVITGCGGGGGGGGGDNDDSTGDGDDNGTTTGLTSEEQVALAAFGSGGSMDAGQAGADESTDSTDDSEMASGASTGSCSDGGEQWFHEDTGGDFALDQVNFEATGVFDGNDSLPTGTDTQTRADNCKNSADGFSSRVDGVTDTARADNLGPDRDGSIGYFIGGGYDGEDPSMPSVDDRDLTTAFESEFESDSFGDFFYSMRGEIWSCGACLDTTDGSFVKDLANPNGDPQRDVGFAGRFEMGFDNITVEAGVVDGNDGDVWTFVSSAGDKANDARFVVDGRYALNDADNPECNFDVTYETPDPLYVDDFLAESTIPSEGEIKVTQNAGDDAGTTYTVDFDTGDPDTLKVNGTTYNRSDLVDDEGCSTGIETESEA